MTDKPIVRLDKQHLPDFKAKPPANVTSFKELLENEKARQKLRDNKNV